MKIEKKDKIKYQSLKPVMAGSLVACIKAIYEDSYPLPEFYDSERIKSLLNKELLYSEIAKNKKGEIVATLSTQLEHPDDLTADTSAGMVLPSYRGHGVLGILGWRMADVYKRLGLCGIQLYAITLHTITQKQILDGGGVVTGILPANFPKGTSPKGFSDFSGRVGVVSFYLPLKMLPVRSVYVPQSYRSLVHNIYRQANVDRKQLEVASIIAGEKSSYDTFINSKTRVIRLSFKELGEDIEDVLSLLTATADANECEVQYLDIPLHSSICEMVVNKARENGFVYGCLILERGGTDKIRLQKFDPATFNPKEMKLATSEIRKNLETVLSEVSLG